MATHVLDFPKFRELTLFSAGFAAWSQQVEWNSRPGSRSCRPSPNWLRTVFDLHRSPSDDDFLSQPRFIIPFWITVAYLGLARRPGCVGAAVSPADSELWRMVDEIRSWHPDGLRCWSHATDVWWLTANPDEKTRVALGENPGRVTNSWRQCRDNPFTVVLSHR